MLVLVGAFAAGDICARLPLTTAGTVCGLCVAFLVGICGSRLLDRWRDDGIGDDDGPPDDGVKQS